MISADSHHAGMNARGPPLPRRKRRVEEEGRNDKIPSGTPGATALPEMEGEQYRKGAEASEKSRDMR